MIWIGNERKWDGGISANTPLREAIISHRRYWANIRKVDHVSGLKIAVVNLPPGKLEYIPPDYDGLIDRKNDIMYHGRTRFDEYVAVVMADLQVLSKSLIKIAEGNSQCKEKIQKLLLKKATLDFSKTTIDRLIDNVIMSARSSWQMPLGRLND
jgi:NTE family protein